MVRFSPRGHLLAAGHPDGGLTLWSVDVAPRRLGQGANPDAVADVLYSPRLSLAVARTAEHLRGWALPDVRETFAWHVGPIDDATFLPDGNHVLVAGDGRFRIVDLRDGRTTREAPLGDVSRMRFVIESKRDCLVALTWAQGEVRLETRALDTLEPLSAVTVSPQTEAFTLAPDGLTAALSHTRGITLVNRADGHARTTLNDPEPSTPDPATTAAWTRGVFSAEGRLLAAGAPTGRVTLFDTARGQAVMTLEGHAGAITDVDMLHGRSTVATCGVDGTVRIWSLARR